MKYVFENLETAIAVERIISANKNLKLPRRYDIAQIINNPEHADYNKAFIEEVLGDPLHHALWMTGVDGIYSYETKEFDPTWLLTEE